MPRIAIDDHAVHAASSCLGDVASSAEVVSWSDACHAVERFFVQRHDLSCVVVVDGDQTPHLLTRRQLMTEMTGPIGYGRALHSNRPILTIAAGAPTLRLPATTHLDEAGRRAIERPTQWRYDDILVESPGGPLSFVTVADLFSHLASVNERLSLTDALTGLVNRSGFARAVSEALQAGDEAGVGRTAVLFVDLDNFKAINDSLGHAAGDDLLAQVAMRMRGAFRQGDVVARLGGDEYAILLPGASSDVAEHTADRVLSLIAEPITVGDQMLHIGASVGIALQDGAHEHVGELLRNADLAMYAAKHQGKAQRSFYRRALHRDAVTRLDVRTELESALQRDELFLRYQPIVDLADRRVVGVEALIRWTHPRLGAIAPLDFLPLAEESGAIRPIGNWVLHEACRQVAVWRRTATAPPISVAVNVSVAQLEIPSFPGHVASELAEADLPADTLTLEITESALARNANTLTNTVQAIQRLGVHFAIDDFGVGFSSFARLDELPFQQIKIDRSFTARLKDGGVNGVLPGLLGMAEAMGIEAVVEGVETDEQADILYGLGYRLAQGYLFSPPRDAADVTCLLRRTPARAGASQAR